MNEPGRCSQHRAGAKSQANRGAPTNTHGEPNSCVRTCQVVEKIAAIPATTLTGLRVKAKAVTWMETDDYKPSAMNDFEWSLHQEVVAGVLALVSVD
jgi:hypothetical protein